MKKITLLLSLVVLILVAGCIGVYAQEILNIGETTTLYASDAQPSYPASGGVSRAYIWSSSNSDVVEIISRNGSSCVVRARKPGKATITNEQSLSYSYRDPILGTMPGWEEGYGGSWTITVRSIPPTDVSLPEETSVVMGKSKTVTPKLVPSNAGTTFRWSSADSNIATVNSEGEVRGINPGETTITAISENGIKATTKVRVNTPMLELVSSVPKDNSEVMEDTAIELQFDRTLSKGEQFDKIVIKDNIERKELYVSATLQGSKLILKCDKIYGGGDFTVYVPKKALKNKYGKYIESDCEIGFKTRVNKLIEQYPSNNSKVFGIEDSVIIQFYSDVVRRPLFSMTKFVNKKTGEDVKFNAEFSGKFIKITPEKPLSYDTEYKLNIAGNTIGNKHSKVFKEAVIIEFSTKSAPLEIISSNPQNQYGILENAYQGMTKIEFNKEISEGENFDKIKVREVRSGKNVDGFCMIFGNRLTFSIEESHLNLKASTVYAFEIPENAVVDENGEGNKYICLNWMTDHPEPEISLNSEGKVVITTPSEEADIYYALNDDAEYGTLYTGPFDLPDVKEVTVKAISISGGQISPQDFETFYPNENTDKLFPRKTSWSPDINKIYITGKSKIFCDEQYLVTTLPVSDEKPVFSVSDKSIAKVSADGVVTPLKKGRFKLNVTVGNLTHSKEIEVTEIPADKQMVLKINSKEATVFGVQKKNDVAPQIKYSRTMLPARFVAENLGASVSWDDSEKKVEIKKDGKIIEIYPSLNFAYINGETRYLDSPAFTENSRVYTPVRFICESLGAEVDWDAENQKIIITP